MEPPKLLKLELMAPLVYSEDRGLEPFDDHGTPGPRAAGDDRLFCFETGAGQGTSIEPDPKLFLGPLVFSGRTAKETGCTGERRELPAGKYLFAQERRILNRDECIFMAVETQKDGLWERLEPESRLYLRFLTEDDRGVTQVFRPYREGEQET
ncbi:MAG: hypothetical protein LBG10_04640 [Treponema sp.]|nr:hypothetical protein [Treponema sp.]